MRSFSRVEDERMEFRALTDDSCRVTSVEQCTAFLGIFWIIPNKTA